MVDVQVFIAFAFGVPEHRDFDSLHLFQRNSTDPPLCGQLATRFIHTVLTTQRHVHRGLRFGVAPGGVSALPGVFSRLGPGQGEGVVRYQHGPAQNTLAHELCAAPLVLRPLRSMCRQRRL